MTDTVKILMLGDGGVGKSSLLSQYVDEKFSENIQATLGVEYKQKKIKQGEKILQVQVWDTAGQERFKTITPIYYRNVQGVSLVFSVIDRQSYIQVKEWINNLKDYAEYEKISIVLVANKCDMASRVVSTLEGQQIAKEFDMNYYECSAKEGTQVKEMFTDIVKQILAKRTSDPSKPTGQQLDQKVQKPAQPEEQKCC